MAGTVTSRYVEANPRRARLVRRSEAWRWSGLWRRAHGGDELPLCVWPVPRPRDWLQRVNATLPPESLAGLRTCAQRGRPLGSAEWVKATAARLVVCLRLIDR